MKVALFTNNYLPRISGVSVAVTFLEQALHEQGHETMVVAPDYSIAGSGLESTDDAQHRVFRFPSFAFPPKHVSVPLEALGRSSAIRAVARFAPDVIHSHHPFSLGKTAKECASALGVPLCYTFHTLYEFFTHYVGLDLDIVRQFVRDLVVDYAHGCDRVIAPTDPIRAHLHEQGCQTPVVTIPTGLDMSRYEQISSDDVAALRQSFGLGSFDSVLLSVGRITKEKNVQLCVDTLAELVEHGRNVALLMIGRGPDSDLMKRRARKLGVEDRLVFGGFLSQREVAAVYRLGNVLLFPSLSDTQGIVLYEALACSVPIVATDSMASRAVLEHGVNGLLAAETHEAFAAAVGRILDADTFSHFSFDSAPFTSSCIGRLYTQLYVDMVNEWRCA
jgi:glycosyltransferase involved in cell wall biosynthesis